MPNHAAFKLLIAAVSSGAIAGASIAAPAPAPGAAPTGPSAGAATAGPPAAGGGRGGGGVATTPSPDGITGIGRCAGAASVQGAAAGGAGRGGAAAPSPANAGVAGAGRGGAGTGGAAAGGGSGATPAANPPLPPIRNTPQYCLDQRSEAGFVDIFNGASLAGWEGAEGRWSVVNGVLTGATTAENPLTANTFLVWTGGVVRDFDLKFEWRLNSGGNSGIQYRSERLPQLGQYVMRGPQYDMGGGPEEPFTANIFEERGVTFLASRGSFSWETPGGRRETIGYVGGGQPGGPQGGYQPTRSLVNSGDWNRGEVIARGDTIIHLLNDQVTGIAIDQYANRLQQGVIGIQLHTGPAMKIEFRSIKLKSL